MGDDNIDAQFALFATRSQKNTNKNKNIGSSDLRFLTHTDERYNNYVDNSGVTEMHQPVYNPYMNVLQQQIMQIESQIQQLLAKQSQLHSQLQAQSESQSNSQNHGMRSGISRDISQA